MIEDFYKPLLKNVDPTIVAAASYQIGRLYLNSMSSYINGAYTLEEAFKWLEAAARLEHVVSINNFGTMHRDGLIKDDRFIDYGEEARDPNYVEAARYYKQAALLGYAPSMRNLVLMYIDKNVDESLKQEICTSFVVSLKSNISTLKTYISNGNHSLLPSTITTGVLKSIIAQGVHGYLCQGDAGANTKFFTQIKGHPILKATRLSLKSPELNKDVGKIFEEICDNIGDIIKFFQQEEPNRAVSNDNVAGTVIDEHHVVRG